MVYLHQHGFPEAIALLDRNTLDEHTLSVFCLSLLEWWSRHPFDPLSSPWGVAPSQERSMESSKLVMIFVDR